ncbi:ABC transporter ATP-binding protein [Alloiococcus sp. CFN-8]|uniref:ABC transporter ATP-binding protein n=1 Tax=Alloiococcus sp. CFN-8 TaxID=3416081 RepID=UPI003CF81345
MKRIFKYILRHKALLLIPVTAMLLVIAADTLTPYVTKLIVDDVIYGDGGFGLLKLLLLAILGLTLIKNIFGYTKEYLFDVLSTKVNESLKNELFNHIQSQEFSYFDSMNTGELMSRIGEDVDNIWRTISFGLRLFVENIIYFVTSSAILFILNYKLALACISIMIPIGFLAIKLEKNIMKSYEAISDQAAVINTTAQENIAGVRLVKAFAREKHEILKFLEMNKTNYNLNMKQAKGLATYYPPIELLTNLSVVIMLIFGGVLVIQGEMSFGDLFAFSQYIWNLVWPMRNLGWLTNMLAQNQASSKKIFAILDRPSKIVSPPNAVSPEVIQGEIDFKEVSFRYSEEEEILKDINLKVEAGSTVAVMGGTGSGKSSLLHLIGRYYDPEEGEVLVDGIPLQEMDLYSLRSSMSVVPEDTFLFSETIRENIRFGNKQATDEEIEAAAKIACCDFIAELEDGFDTLVGERGIGLSGGQKQRISIARAIIRNSAILILDDATSALDMETEYALLKNLKNRINKCTTFIIAHRISSVKNADKIIFLENGTIVEEGTHEELLKLRGRYYEIYCEQFKDFKALESEVV